MANTWPSLHTTCYMLLQFLSWDTDSYGRLGLHSGSRSFCGSPSSAGIGRATKGPGMGWKQERCATYVIRKGRPSNTSSPLAHSPESCGTSSCTPWGRNRFLKQQTRHCVGGGACDHCMTETEDQAWTPCLLQSLGRCGRNGTPGASGMLQPL